MKLYKLSEATSLDHLLNWLQACNLLNFRLLVNYNHVMLAVVSLPSKGSKKKKQEYKHREKAQEWNEFCWATIFSL
jgi:hypothetical protein